LPINSIWNVWDVFKKRWLKICLICRNNNSKFYDIPDTKTDRSTSLGYGNKMDLAKQYFIKPGPGQYDYKS
jgi:hypothetical protein